jgi:osmotically-inducible protein OsmY
MKVKLLAAAMMAAGLALSGCASHRDNAASGESRTAGQFTSDAALTAKVKTALAQDAGLGTAADVNVNSYNGVVQLNGFVDSADKIQRAADVARGVNGVSRVDNNLQVKPRS